MSFWFGSYPTAGLMPALRRQRQTDICEIKASLVYRMCSRTAKATEKKGWEGGIYFFNHVKNQSQVSRLGNNIFSTEPSHHPILCPLCASNTLFWKPKKVEEPCTLLSNTEIIIMLSNNISLKNSSYAIVYGAPGYG